MYKRQPSYIVFGLPNWFDCDANNMINLCVPPLKLKYPNDDTPVPAVSLNVFNADDVTNATVPAGPPEFTNDDKPIEPLWKWAITEPLVIPTPFPPTSPIDDIAVASDAALPPFHPYPYTNDIGSLITTVLLFALVVFAKLSFTWISYWIVCPLLIVDLLWIWYDDELALWGTNFNNVAPVSPIDAENGVSDSVSAIVKLTKLVFADIDAVKLEVTLLNDNVGIWFANTPTDSEPLPILPNWSWNVIDDVIVSPLLDGEPLTCAANDNCPLLLIDTNGCDEVNDWTSVVL